MTKQDIRKLPRVVAEAIRMKVVNAVADEGMSRKEAARIFAATRTSVSLWIKAYRSGGEKALRTKPLGRPKGKRLSDAQAAGIRKKVISRCHGHPHPSSFL